MQLGDDISKAQAAMAGRPAEPRLPATHIPIAFRRFDPPPRAMSIKIDFGGVRAAFQDLAS